MLIDLPRILAEVDLRIHAAETKPVIEALTAAGLSRDASLDGRLDQLAERIDARGLDGLRSGLEWLRRHRPETGSDDVVCHCDMQPLNLLVQDGRLTGILDWANTSIGPPELELGWTRAIYLTLDLPLPGPLRFLQGSIAGFLSDRYLRVYARSRPIDRAAVGYFEAFRSVVALSILAEWVVRGEVIRDAWNSRSAVDRVRRLVRARSGVEVSIPWAD